MTKQHWMDELVEAMRGDRHAMMKDLRDVYTDIRPLRGAAQKMAPKQELQAFMGMQQEDRLRMATEMGPEEYQKFVMGKMNQMVSSMGPAAQKMLPYLLAPIEHVDSEIDRDTLETELMGMLNSEE